MYKNFPRLRTNSLFSSSLKESHSKLTHRVTDSPRGNQVISHTHNHALGESPRTSVSHTPHSRQRVAIEARPRSLPGEIHHQPSSFSRLYSSYTLSMGRGNRVWHQDDDTSPLDNGADVHRGSGRGAEEGCGAAAWLVFRGRVRRGSFRRGG